ncbi:MAG: ABC transporter permease [Lachnospira sp.]|nr:ABC transporter permease [Lachnospira sp.]
MKKFSVVFMYELKNYIQNKSYMVSTIVIAVLLAAIMFLPRVIDMSGMLGDSTSTSSPTQDSVEENEDVNQSSENVGNLLIYDKSGVFGDLSLVKSAFYNYTIQTKNSKEDIEEAVKNSDDTIGFVVNSMTEYDYYVNNSSMYDSNCDIFNNLLITANQIKFCQDNGLDYEKSISYFYPDIKSNKNVLGKDMSNNYTYCYILIIFIFMIIILYGVMVATSVTQEKSNRTIEVLITSSNTNVLFFGKVFAGAVAALFQTALILGATIISYQINRDAWNGILDFVLDIPSEVLITFAFFGLGGFLFYTFIYGAVGALVSKTEDINKSSGGIQMIIMIVYFAVLVQLSNIDGIVMKVASWLPISSYSAMFARVAMGNVAMWEIVVSLVILIVSIIGVGFLGAAIYRMGTLRYGNPIKLSNAIKAIKNNK